MMTNVMKLAFDLHNNSLVGCTKDEAENVIRTKIDEICGNGQGGIDFYKFKARQYEVFALLAETLTVATNYLANDAYNMFVEFKDVALGDQVYFEVENTELYQVSQTAISNQDITRQRLVGKKVPTTNFNLSVKIYEELVLFQAGRVDFAKMVAKVGQSLNVHVSSLIAKAMFNSYTELTAPYIVSGAFDSNALLDLVSEVEVASGQQVVIMGTKKAVGHLIKDITDAPETVKTEIWNTGLIGKYYGIPVVVLPQAKDKNGLIADDNTLIVIPVSEKPVKFGWVGEAFVNEGDGSSNNLLQLEYFFTRQAALAIIVSSAYAMYRIS